MLGTQITAGQLTNRERMTMQVYDKHSLKNRTGNRTGEVVGSGFQWSNRRFIGSLATENRNI